MKKPFLIIALISLLISCSSKTSKDNLIGKWTQYKTIDSEGKIDTTSTFYTFKTNDSLIINGVNFSKPIRGYWHKKNDTITIKHLSSTNKLVIIKQSEDSLVLHYPFVFKTITAYLKK